MTPKLTWGRCDCCGGELPVIDEDNGSGLLPRRLKHGGECPGHTATEMLCGAYEGWSRTRLLRYLGRRGVRDLTGRVVAPRSLTAKSY